MSRVKSLVSAAAIALMMVVSVDYLAFAATGRSFVLGQGNTADRATSLTRTTPGPALQVNVKNGAGAPIKVNSKGRVGKLNADYVDGKHATDLGVRTRVYTRDILLTATSSMEFSLPDVAAGSYLATMDAWIYGPTGQTMHCYLRGGGIDDRLQEYFPAVVGNSFFPVSTAGVVTLPTTLDLTVRCNAGASGNWSDYNGFQVTLTRIDVRTNAATFPSRTRSAGSAGAAGLQPGQR